MMWRRLIPLAMALVAGFVVSWPVLTGDAGGAAANTRTLVLLALVFLVKGALFWWMRRRMNPSDARQLTLFGQALRDLFLAVVVFNAASALFWGVFAWAAWQRSPLARWEAIGLRGVLAATSALVIGAAFGAGWEMSMARTGRGMVVHVDAAGGGERSGQ